MTTPRLYPVTLQLVCPTHGLVKELTVTSLRAQEEWVSWYRAGHGETCDEPVAVLVPDKQSKRSA